MGLRQTQTRGRYSRLTKGDQENHNSTHLGIWTDQLGGQGHRQAELSRKRALGTVLSPKDTQPIVTRHFDTYGGRIQTCPIGVRFHIQQESDIPASTQLYNQICFAIAARHYPPGHRLPSTRQLAMQTGLHRNTISKVYRQLENDGVVEAMAGSGIYVRDQQKPREIQTQPRMRNRGVTDLDREVRKCVDGLLNAGCTLQQTRELLTQEIDWRLRCGARVLVSTPREDIGASMLIAEELEPCLDVPVEVVPMEELESVLENLQRHSGHKPIFPATSRGSRQKTQRSGRGG